MTSPNLNEPACVLVVEDDYSIRESLQVALEYEGYQVVTAENGQDALDKLKTGRKPDLILLDLMMPVLGGRQFLKQFLADPIHPTIPVVVVSAEFGREGVVGATDFVRKPVDLELLLNIVARYTERAQP